MHFVNPCFAEGSLDEFRTRAKKTRSTAKASSHLWPISPNEQFTLCRSIEKMLQVMKKTGWQL